MKSAKHQNNDRCRKASLTRDIRSSLRVIRQGASEFRNQAIPRDEEGKPCSLKKLMVPQGSYRRGGGTRTSTQSLDPQTIHWYGSDDEEDIQAILARSAPIASIHNGVSDSEDDENYYDDEDSVDYDDDDASTDSEDDEEDMIPAVASKHNGYDPNDPKNDLMTPPTSQRSILGLANTTSPAGQIRDAVKTRINTICTKVANMGHNDNDNPEKLLKSFPVRNKTLKLLTEKDDTNDVDEDDIEGSESLAFDDDGSEEYEDYDEDYEQDLNDSQRSGRERNPINNLNKSLRALGKTGKHWIMKRSSITGATQKIDEDESDDDTEENNGSNGSQSDLFRSADQPKNQQEAAAILVCRELELMDI